MQVASNNQTIHARGVGDRVGDRFVFDRRMGGACLRWSTLSRTRDSNRARFSADDLFSHVSTVRRCATSDFASDNFIAAAKLLVLPTLIAIALIIFISWISVERLRDHDRCVGDYCCSFRYGHCFSSMSCKAT